MLLRTGVTRFSRAGETESQQEEGECLEEDVGVVVVGGAHQEVDRHQDFGDVNSARQAVFSAFTAPLAYIYIYMPLMMYQQLGSCRMFFVAEKTNMSSVIH
jgi:hypothetical protein